MIEQYIFFVGEERRIHSDNVINEAKVREIMGIEPDKQLYVTEMPFDDGEKLVLSGEDIELDCIGYKRFYSPVTQFRSLKNELGLR